MSNEENNGKPVSARKIILAGRKANASLSEESKLRRTLDFTEMRDPENLARIDARAAAEGDCETSRKIREILSDENSQVVGKDFEEGVVSELHDIVVCKYMCMGIGSGSKTGNIRVVEEVEEGRDQPIDLEATGDNAIINAMRHGNHYKKLTDSQVKIKAARTIVRDVVIKLASRMGVNASDLMIEEAPDGLPDEVQIKTWSAFDSGSMGINGESISDENIIALEKLIKVAKEGDNTSESLTKLLGTLFSGPSVDNYITKTEATGKEKQ